jgi:hypothetical protein
MEGGVMKFRIHFELPDGTEDAIDIVGATIDIIKEQATYEIEKRKGANPWSEELT